MQLCWVREIAHPTLYALAGNSVSIIDTELNIKNLQRICGMNKDRFDLTPEEEEEMRICFLEIVKKYRSTENDPELTPEPNAFDLES